MLTVPLTLKQGVPATKRGLCSDALATDLGPLRVTCGDAGLEEGKPKGRQVEAGVNGCRNALLPGWLWRKPAIAVTYWCQSTNARRA